VQKLLANAKKDLNDLRLTSPAGNNAFEKYKQVLKIDPENEDALNGMQSIANKYVRLAHSNMESEKFDRAKYYLNKAEQIAPGSENIQAAQNKLQAKLQEKKDKEQQEQIVQTEDATTAESSSEEEATEGETTEDESSDGFMSGVKDWLKKDIEKNKDIDMEDTSSEKVKRVLGGQ
jgi:tetratricopeptide (TPR) repeat protein